MLDDLIKLPKLMFLILIELLHDEFLRVDAIPHLLLELLQGGLHPMLVVFGWGYLAFF
jgi:hypothetical protein